MSDASFSKISFYVVAHADDWQLFMQPNAYNDIMASDNKVVFIITTAGDAGLGEAFWMAREEGCKSSIRFCTAPTDSFDESTGTRQCNNHPIRYWSAGDTTCYFLRLPDGNLDGRGFSSNQYQSLAKFRAREVNSIAALDSSTSYSTWSDFCATLQAIIDLESQRIADQSINYLNPDLTMNPNDHIDHIATGYAIEEMPRLLALKQKLFVGYSVSTNRENLKPIDLFWKTGMFAAYEKAVFDQAGYSTLKESVDTYVNWCASGPKFITRHS